MARTDGYNISSGDTAYLIATVEFSRIKTPYEGDELKREIQRQLDIGFKYPNTDPYYRLAVTDPYVFQKSSDDMEGLILDKFSYEGKDGQIHMNLNRNAYARSGKERFIPTFELPEDRNNNPKPIALKAEIASGQQIILGFNVYESPYAGSNGLLVDWQDVYVPANVEYFTTGGVQPANFGGSQLPDSFFLKSTHKENPTFKEELESEEDAPSSPNQQNPDQNNPFASQGQNQPAQGQNQGANPFRNQGGQSSNQGPLGGQNQNNPFGNRQSSGGGFDGGSYDGDLASNPFSNDGDNPKPEGGQNPFGNNPF